MSSVATTPETGGRPRRGPITDLPPAEALTLKLGPPHALRVRVKAADGEAVDRARVTLVNGGDATPERALRPGDVVAVFPPLAGGRR